MTATITEKPESACQLPRSRQELIDEAFCLLVRWRPTDELGTAAADLLETLAIEYSEQGEQLDSVREVLSESLTMLHQLDKTVDALRNGQAV